ncbi:MAG TPA: YkgJ family cysteine cluster protein [Thermosynechococcaceae cyanobacterium]
MPTWRCVKQCGACCHLDPTDRPDLEDYLLPAELALYLSMVGADGWCIHFDHATRECSVYDDRPRFCRVEPDVFQDLFGVEPTELNDFAIACCREQIEGVYGDRSLEQLRFEREVGIEPISNIDL